MNMLLTHDIKMFHNFASKGHPLDDGSSIEESCLQGGEEWLQGMEKSLDIIMICDLSKATVPKHTSNTTGIV